MYLQETRKGSMRLPFIEELPLQGVLCCPLL